MNFARFNRSAAEDGQKSFSPTWQEATLLNMADNIIRQIEEMRTFNTDTYLDGYMTDAVQMMRGLKESVEG